MGKKRAFVLQGLNLNFDFAGRWHRTIRIRIRTAAGSHDTMPPRWGQGAGKVEPYISFAGRHAHQVREYATGSEPPVNSESHVLPSDHLNILAKTLTVVIVL